jgi:hypothetical protein
MKEPNLSIHPSISHSTRRLGLRAAKPSFLLRLVLLAWCSSNSVLQAQSVGEEARFLLMKGEAETREFYQLKADFERSKELERAQIPQYNMDLSLTVSRFHKHIADMHYRHVTCSICREHIKKIKELAKKIDQGMK